MPTLDTAISPTYRLVANHLHSVR